MSPDNESRGNDLSQERERRLWFDYIAKLNDRSIQTARESGATNWVLLGVAVAILYKSVPQLPQWLLTTNAVRSALVIFLLEIDTFLFFAMAFIFLVHFSAGNIEKRLLPVAHERLHQVTIWAAVAALLTLAVVGVWLAITFDAQPIWIRGILGGFGLWWALNIGMALKGMFQTSQAAKKVGVSVPRFMASIGQSSRTLVISAIMVALGVVPLVALLASLRGLNHSPIGWVTPLSAATHALVLCGVVGVLFLRVLYQSRYSAFQNLERAIVVENLAPIEIRSRFVTQLLGTSIADWMVGSIDGIKSADAKLKACAESVRGRLPDVESVEAQYALERKGRAKKLLEELQAAIAEHQSSFKQFQFQLLEYAKVSRSAEDEAMLKKMTADLQAWLTEVKLNSAFTADLVKTLTKF